MRKMENGRQGAKELFTEVIFPGLVMAACVAAVMIALAQGIDKEAPKGAPASSFFSVDNPVEASVYAVSKSLDIDQASYRQASTRRPERGRPAGVENL